MKHGVTWVLNREQLGTICPVGHFLVARKATRMWVRKAAYMDYSAGMCAKWSVKDGWKWEKETVGLLFCHDQRLDSLEKAHAATTADAALQMHNDPVSFRRHLEQTVQGRSEADMRAYWVDKSISKKTNIDDFILVEKEILFYCRAFCHVSPNKQCLKVFIRQHIYLLSIT
jgi:hypothetical protein